MNFVKMLLGALAGGVIGAAIWCGISYSTGYEIGWIAWGIGVLTGLGARLAARTEGGVLAGLVAGAVALASIGLGKSATAFFLVNSALNQVQIGEVSDNDLIVPLADKVVGEFKAKKKRLAWPPGMTVETASEPADYPKDVWTEAKKRFDALPKTEVERQRQQALDERWQTVGAIKGMMHAEATRSMFTPHDALWAFLAIASAFKIGGGPEPSRT
jgi:hypothetical protein